MNNKFVSDSALVYMPSVDTSNATQMGSMFSGAYNLLYVAYLETKNVKLLSSMFKGCSKLISVQTIDATSATACTDMFRGNLVIKEISIINTGNVMSMSRMFYACQKLVTLNRLDADKADDITEILINTPKLTEFGGLKNLGKAYATKTEHYGNYTLSLSSSTLLTHDSLMNVINNLYDLNQNENLSVDGVCQYRQSLALGSTNLAKLTAEEIAIATNKGWDVT